MKKFLQTIKFDLIDIVVLSFYYIFTCFLFLGMFGLFNRFFVFVILIFLLLVIFLLRHRVSFNKKYLWFFVLAPLVTAGFGFLRGFIDGDAYSLWLPAARDTIAFGYFPDFSIAYQFSRMPLLSILMALTFSVFDSLNEFICLWIPFFFSSAILIVIYKWAKNKNLDKKFLFFIPVLFLTNILVAWWGGWNLLQEALVLFFATTFFYYY